MTLRLPKWAMGLGFGFWLAGSSADSAQAAEILVSRATETAALITITGELDFIDAIDFLRKTGEVKEAVVLLRSPGGNVVAGISIGRAIRQKGFLTVVPASTNCSSACALAWLGGTPRFMGEGAQIGFHAAYMVRGGRARRSITGNVALAEYVDGLGLSPQAVAYITGAPPERMYWLTRITAQAVGIEAGLYGASGIVNTLDRASPTPMTIQDATDYPGNDIGRLRRTNLEACLAACSKSAVCKAFTFIANRRECWLKNKLSSAEPGKGLVSGVKAAGPGRAEQSPERLPDKD
ncbi:MAG TPA: PAN domain-containing protein [Nordella sp.]|nr:PAN domain-containing protein [Nordella sp.]